MTPFAARVLALAVLLPLVLAAAPILRAAETGPAAVQTAVAAARDHRMANEIGIIDEFRDLLSLPNVAANVADMTANAEWIERYLHARKFRVSVVSAGGAPYVIAERVVDGAAKTVLVYAHFDGQPVTPAEWASPPFEPTLRTGRLEEGAGVVPWETLAAPVDADWRIYARSAGDDKAPIIALAAALDALDAAGLEPAVNVKLILDGEEEAGSPTLAGVLEAHADRLNADLMLFCDGPMHQSRQRQVVFGVRGSMGVDLTAYGPNRPLHSGHYGNWAPNPTDRLIRWLDSLKDADGGITVAGFHDRVRPPTDAELAAIAAMPAIDGALQKELGLAVREGGEERLERLLLDPAIIVNGIQAGGVGNEAANVIRPTSTASLNIRLVPDQTPQEILGVLTRHFQSLGVHVVTEAPDAGTLAAHEAVLLLEGKGGYPGFRTRLDGPEARELVRLLDAIDGEATLKTPTMGGSLPIYLFEQALSMPIVLLPVANHDNNQHGANENLRLRNLWDAIEIYAAVLYGFGRD